jgi:phytoene/squalene synthetase
MCSTSRAVTARATRACSSPVAANTVREVCEDYVRGRHKLRATSKAKLEYDLRPLIERHGDEPVQRLTKAHIDELVADLRAGGTKTAKGRTRRPWGAIAVKKFTQTVAIVLADA